MQYSFFNPKLYSKEYINAVMEATMRDGGIRKCEVAYTLNAGLCIVSTTILNGGEIGRFERHNYPLENGSGRIYYGEGDDEQFAANPDNFRICDYNYIERFQRNASELTDFPYGMELSNADNDRQLIYAGEEDTPSGYIDAATEIPKPTEELIGLSEILEAEPYYQEDVHYYWFVFFTVDCALDVKVYSSVDGEPLKELDETDDDSAWKRTRRERTTVLDIIGRGCSNGPGPKVVAHRLSSEPDDYGDDMGALWLEYYDSDEAFAGKTAQELEEMLTGIMESFQEKLRRYAEGMR